MILSGLMSLSLRFKTGKIRIPNNAEPKLRVVAKHTHLGGF